MLTKNFEHEGIIRAKAIPPQNKLLNFSDFRCKKAVGYSEKSLDYMG